MASKTQCSQINICIYAYICINICVYIYIFKITNWVRWRKVWSGLEGKCVRRELTSIHTKGYWIGFRGRDGDGGKGGI